MTMTRRELIQVGIGSLAGISIVSPHVLGGPKFVAPSDRVNIALIGAGGQGRTNLRSLFEQPDAQLIAVADPAESFSLQNFYYKGQGGRQPIRHEIEQRYSKTTPNYRCAEYIDFREMLEKESAVDAVLCATPDHLHAYVSVLSMRAGKHVYCEKPLTHNIWEARYVDRVARETGVATQMGNQGHSTDAIRETCEWIWDGAIGVVRQVDAWVSGHRWNPTLTGRPSETPATPVGLNWDLWLGPRRPRPFHPAYFPVAWRDFWAFGGSNIADFGCHDLDAACWALDLHAPEMVEFHPAGIIDAEIGPHGCVGHFHFGPRGDRPEVNINWYDGGLQPFRPDELPDDEQLPDRGILFRGDRGVLLCGGAGGPVRLLGTGNEQRPKPKPTLVRSKGHHREWLDACKGGPPAGGNFSYGARLTEIALLGVLALRAGKPIHWDAERMQAKGLPSAEALIKEPYRSGWELEGA